MPDDRIEEANALAKQGKLREAAEAYQAILKAGPDVEALHNLAVILGQLGHSAAALEALEATVKHKPDFAEAWRNLGAMYSRADHMGDAIRAYRKSIELQPEFPEAHSSLLLMSPYRVPYGPDVVKMMHKMFGRRFADPLTIAAPPDVNDFEPNRRLRIGYVSPDFREHSVAYFIEPALAGHRAAEVEVYCYSDVAQDDATTARLRILPHHWRDVLALDHAQLAAQIRADRIDILIDLAGHTGNNRLLTFARKPAPVQVSFLGYPMTTGVSAIDYRITDDYADPCGETERYWTEQLIRLPRTAWCYRPPTNSPEPNPALQPRITFGCFARSARRWLYEQTVWPEIFRRVPRARLLLRDDLPPTHGIEQHLARYQHIDIALDTYPYHGTTTTCEALWMGVPVITRAGQSHISRVGVSLLSNVGLGELVAESDEQYVELAVALASDRARLSALRHDLRQRMKASPLMDEAAFVRDLEAAYRTMWMDACDRADQSRRGQESG